MVFLDIVDKAKMDAEKKQQIEEDKELMDYRKRVASLQEKSMDEVSIFDAIKLVLVMNIWYRKTKRSAPFTETRGRSTKSKTKSKASYESSITEIHFVGIGAKARC